MEYITTATTGNTTDFGNLTVARSTLKRGGTNSVTGVFNGGLTPSFSNVMDSITIASTADASDFGDLIDPTAQSGGSQSNGHGGLVGG